ncbi:MAG: helix-turn-helix domain-containing protein [Holophagales bacterium]|nr:helix-turn-helix domain-containing protein [Holophagales bacterium]
MSDLYRALADPTRRAILDELVERDGQSLFELCGRLTMKHGIGSSRQAISQHLEVLESAGLVMAKRQGRYRFHWFDGQPLKAIAERWPTNQQRSRPAMRINLSGLPVDDQEKALGFYTETLGFQKKRDIPLGEHRWITVVSPEDPDGTELVLEPDEHPAVRPFKSALVEDGIPFTSFAVTDVAAEHERLEALGVRFTQQPTDLGTVITAVFDDTCGNLIQIVQETGKS